MDSGVRVSCKMTMYRIDMDGESLSLQYGDGWSATTEYGGKSYCIVSEESVKRILETFRVHVPRFTIYYDVGYADMILRIIMIIIIIPASVCVSKRDALAHTRKQKGAKNQFNWRSFQTTEMMIMMGKSRKRVPSERREVKVET